jgi:nucleoside-diphosphate-sugar epimerase
MDVVFGCNGPVGVELMGRLHAQGRRVRGVCRSGRSEAPEGVEIVAGDLADAEAAKRLAEGAQTVFCCVGVDYTRWPDVWPALVRGLIAAAASSGARLVFADNLYAYGPVDGPLREGLPPTTYGRKPALRARLASELLEAHASGRVRATLVRAADFYGPRALLSVLGARVFLAALQGRAAQLLADIDQPHTFTYVPDFARALATVADDARAFGRIWHVPNAPACTTREVVGIIYLLADRRPRVTVLPLWAMSLLGYVSPLMRELNELRFQRDRPYVVDHSAFAATFYPDFTPLEDGLRATLDWFRTRA